MFSPVPLLPLLAQEEDRSQAIGARAAELEEKAERVRVSAAKRGAQLDRWAGSETCSLGFRTLGLYAPLPLFNTFRATNVGSSEYSPLTVACIRVEMLERARSAAGRQMLRMAAAEAAPSLKMGFK